MATLKDVSREAGVSLTQTSRALGGHADVSAATRARVETAARRLGYRANLSARALRSGRSGLVALAAPAPAGDETDDVLLEIVTGLSAALAARSLRLVLHVLQAGEDAAEAHRRLWAGGGIDAFVVIGPEVGDRRIARLHALGVPFVVHGAEPSGSHGGVDLDNAAAAQRMAEEMLALGHRRIALVEGPKAMTFARDRRDGYARALAAAGVDVDSALATHGPMTVADGVRRGAALLARPDPPTAVVCGNIMLAEGVIEAGRVRRLRVPADLSILAHDDGLHRHRPDRLAPLIGGTASPLRDAWRPLADALVARLDGAGAGLTMLAPTFVPGASTARKRD